MSGWLIVLIILIVLCLLVCCCVIGVWTLMGPAVGNVFSTIIEQVPMAP